MKQNANAQSGFSKVGVRPCSLKQKMISSVLSAVLVAGLCPWSAGAAVADEGASALSTPAASASSDTAQQAAPEKGSLTVDAAALAAQEETNPYEASTGDGDVNFDTLADAISRVRAGGTIKLLKDITLTNTLALDKSLVINADGHTLSYAGAGYAITVADGNSFTLQNAEVVSSGFGVGTAGTFSGALTIQSSTITVAKRGINVGSGTSAARLTVEDSVVQTNVADPTLTYIADQDDGRGINIVPSGMTASIKDTTVQGFSYVINLPPMPVGATVNITGGTLTGRAALNVWGKENTFTLQGVTMNGLNNQTGPTEAFAVIVDNANAQSNTYRFKDCTFNAHLSNEAISTPGSSAAEYLLSLRGQNAIVSFENATYQTNSAERGGLTDQVGSGSQVTADAATAEALEPYAQKLESIGYELVKADDGTYALNVDTTHMVFCYRLDTATDDDGNPVKVENGRNCVFEAPFETGSLKDGEFIRLLGNLKLTQDIEFSTATGAVGATGGLFTIEQGAFSMDANGHTIALPVGVTVASDKQLPAGLLTVPEGYLLGRTPGANGAQEYAAVAEADAVAAIGETKYATLQDALDAVQSGQTVMLLKDATGVFESAQSYTLDLAGHKVLTSEGSYALRATEGAVTLKDSSNPSTGAVMNASTAGGTGAIKVDAGASLVVESGSVSGRSAISSNGALTVKNGSITGVLHGIYTTGTCSIEDGAIAATGSSGRAVYSTAVATEEGAQEPAPPALVISGGTISGVQVGVYTSGEKASATISGGEIKDAQFGLYVVSGTAQVTDGVIAAGGSASGVKYGVYNLKGALTIQGGAISAPTDSTAQGRGIYTGADATTVMAGGSATGYYGVSNDGSFTLRDGTVTGSRFGITSNATGTVVISDGTVAGGTRALDNFGTATVSGGVLTTTSTTSNTYCIINEAGGKLAVEGGTVSTPADSTKKGYGIWNYEGSQVDFSNATIENATYGLWNGGTLHMTSGTVAVETGINGIAGSTTVVSGGTITGTVRAINNSGDLTLSNATLETTGSAWSVVQNTPTGTFTMLSGKLKGAKIGVGNQGATTVADGQVYGPTCGIYNYGPNTQCTVTGGQVTADTTAIVSGVANGTTPGVNCTVTVTGGTVAATGDSETATAIYCQAKGSTTVTLSGNAQISCPAGYGVAVFDNDTLIMKGGTITSHWQCITNNGSDPEPSVMTITGGTLISDTTAIYHPGRGTLTINTDDGPTTITGGLTGIEIRAGDLTISGDPVISGGTGAYYVHANGSGSTVNNAGIAVSQHSTKLPIRVTISGGTITGTMGLVEANPLENSEEDLEKIEISVSGGSFSTKVEDEFCASTYLPTEFDPETGMYTVTRTQETMGLSAEATDATFTGFPIETTVSVVLDGGTGEALEAGKDYEVISYKDETGKLIDAQHVVYAGNYSAVVKGIGAYADVAVFDVPFKVNPASLKDVVLEMKPNYELVYCGSPVEGLTAALLGDYQLKENVDYYAAYANNDAPGTATVVLTARSNGNFVDEAKQDFSIAEAVASKSGVGFDVVDPAYTGKTLQPEITFAAAPGADPQVLEVGKDYVVSYLDANGAPIDASQVKNAGAYTALITGAGDYDGIQVACEFNVAPLLLSQTAVEGLSAVYEQTGKPITPQFTLKLGDTVVPASDYTIAYADNQKGGTGRITITPATANVSGSQTATFAIADASIDMKDVTVSAIPDQIYTSEPITPQFTVKSGNVTLKEGTDYSVAWKNNTEVGTATLTITGKGNVTLAGKPSVLTGSKSVTFAIKHYDTSVGFKDLKASAWYMKSSGMFKDIQTRYLDYALARGLLTGYTGKNGKVTKFGPNDKVTRGQVATVLYRMANPGAQDTTVKSQYAKNTTGLKDVKNKQYYTAAVNWAFAKGVVTGYTDKKGNPTRFGPNDPVTREQLATMLYRYVTNVCGKSAAGSALKAKDKGKVSKYARTAMQWVVAVDALHLRSTKVALSPKSAATRAEMAQMIAVVQRNVL